MPDGVLKHWHVDVVTAIYHAIYYSGGPVEAVPLGRRMNVSVSAQTVVSPRLSRRLDLAALPYGKRFGFWVLGNGRDLRVQTPTITNKVAFQLAFYADIASPPVH
jgi:hypothetical protein